MTSLSDDVAALRRVLRSQDAPVVLVGHSYGGAVDGSSWNKVTTDLQRQGFKVVAAQLPSAQAACTKTAVTFRCG